MLSTEGSKQLKIAALCTLLFFSLTALKIFVSSRSEFHQAQEFAAKGNHREALTHYERAILWYLPLGAGYAEASAKAIWQIATGMETQDKQGALNAYRSLRSAFIAARSFYTPGRDWITRSEEKIAVLMSEKTVYSEVDRKKSLDQKTAEALDILRRPMKPDVFWSTVVVLGFLGWLSGTLIFIWKAFLDSSGKIKNRSGLVWGSFAIIFYALWIIGMMKA